MIKRRLLVALALTGLLWAGGLPARAQPMEPDFTEQQALALIDQKKYIALREQAEKMLADAATKDRYSTYYFMGWVLHHGEGDLPRAHWYLDEAIKRFTKQYGASPSSGSLWGWLFKIYEEQIMVNAELDHYEDQLKSLDQLQAMLESVLGRKLPELDASYSWPLMKLGRVAEAREKLASASEATQNTEQVTNVLNSLGALEMETDHAQASYDAFKKMVDEVRAHGWQMTCTYLWNTAEAAQGLMRYDEAEKLYLEAAQHPDSTSFSNPWRPLCMLYLSQARIPEAISALKKMHAWDSNTEPFLEQQGWAARRQMTCTVMLQLGMTEQALALATTMVDRPDRKGGDSVQRDQWQAGNLLTYRQAAQARRQTLREQMTWTHGWAWWKMLWQQRDLAWSAYLRGQQAAAMLVSHNHLLGSLRYYMASGSAQLTNFDRPDLVTVFGPGTILAALDQLEAKPWESLPLEKPLLDSIRFEALARSGRKVEALALLESLLTQLPASEVLLKARCQARAAQLHLQSGELAQALPLLQTVMEKYPGLMRQFDMELPVSFASDSDALSQQVVSLCRRSPRFKETAGAFMIQVQGTTARLLGPDGSVLSTATMPVPAEAPAPAPSPQPSASATPSPEVVVAERPDPAKDPAAALTAELHDRFFAAQVDLSQLDIGSLDGVVTGTRQSKELQDTLFPEDKSSQDVTGGANP